jgi:hypothetical protein
MFFFFDVGCCTPLPQHPLRNRGPSQISSGVVGSPLLRECVGALAAALPLYAADAEVLEAAFPFLGNATHLLTATSPDVRKLKAVAPSAVAALRAHRYVHRVRPACG